MKLSEKSIEWAVKHLIKESDTDLFPRPIEIDIIQEEKASLFSMIKDIDLGNYVWRSFRRFIIPKGELSYRIVTQLNPLDSLILSAIIHEYGQRIESKRSPVSDKKVFSYRFSPHEDGTLYSNKNSWGDFWSFCHEKAKGYECIACLDISDFYNQIYHHTVENMLIDVGIPNQVKLSIMNLLEYITQKTSRGVPVGPHASHLLAEMSLIPIDNSMEFYGIEFCRYADDIIVFAKDENDARAKIFRIAGILDSQQRLVLQRQKTKLLNQEKFLEYSDLMIKDNPLDIQENQMMSIIKIHTNNDPYVKIKLENLTDAEIQVFSKTKIEELIRKYLSSEYPDYPRLRWFFRRLTQIGIGEAVNYCIQNMDSLIPAISDVCQYLISATNSYEGEWSKLGDATFDLLRSELFKSNEFFQITLLNLFVCNPAMNHINKLAQIYQQSSENIKRKIILSAYKNHAVSFIHEMKEQYPNMQEWNKRSFLIACSILPIEERKFFLNYAKSFFDNADYLERTLVKWAMKQ